MGPLLGTWDKNPIRFPAMLLSYLSNDTFKSLHERHPGIRWKYLGGRLALRILPRGSMVFGTEALHPGYMDPLGYTCLGLTQRVQIPNY